MGFRLLVADDQHPVCWVGAGLEGVVAGDASDGGEVLDGFAAFRADVAEENLRAGGYGRFCASLVSGGKTVLAGNLLRLSHIYSILGNCTASLAFLVLS